MPTSLPPQHTTALPIDPVLPDLVTALRARGRVVLEAPPGAGKTTRVPLALLDAGFDGKILMLEPRRLAARAAANRMAHTLGEPTGQTVGYRMRGATKSSATTRIEVVTEGILTRMLQNDPDLPGIGTVIFDEFHERSLNADLGLALTWEVRQALREDLNIVVMSATLDAGPIAAMLEAPVIRAEGRSFPVTIHHLEAPLAPRSRIDQAMSDMILHVLPQTTGGLLAFLPGEREIRRSYQTLRSRVGTDVEVHMLFGAQPFAAQKAATAPAKDGVRHVILATSIAETSLTLPGITVVIDSGLSRRARYNPGSGMSQLITEKVTKAEATQRTGRAGRITEGTCYRLWTKGQEAALAAFPPAEIEAADLTPLALELAGWGGNEQDLAFLTPPPPANMAEARTLLQTIGAIDETLRLTAHGQALVALPLHPRLGHMLHTAGRGAAPLAALLQDRDPVETRSIDARLRIEAVENPGKFRRDHGLPLRDAAVSALQAEVKRLQNRAPKDTDYTLAEAAALAYPDRIGLRRPGDQARFILSGGKGAAIDEADPMASERLIVALDLDGDTREARIRLALPLPEASLRKLYGAQIRTQDICEWSKRHSRVLARSQEVFGALILTDKAWSTAEPEAIGRAMCTGIRLLGMNLTGPAARLQGRIEKARAAGHPDLPDTSDSALLEELEIWLLPHLTQVRSAADWKGYDATPALMARLGWDGQQKLAQLFPAHFNTPLGRKVAIDYSGESPAISLRLQELFGQTHHPTAGGEPLQITLLSPGGKPVQVTKDLAGFWASSYDDVRKDMRGRYPKHPWPEDPTQAAPTLRAKPRK